MYAVIIGSASTLLSNLDIVQSERKRKLDEIRAYLRHRKVGKKLRGISHFLKLGARRMVHTRMQNLGLQLMKHIMLL